jgi:predicted MFS family arabinose efflux permease
LVVALLAARIDRRGSITTSLALLSLPTMFLASAPDLTTFAVLRIAQGVFMSAAFTLTIAYLGERCSAAAAGGALAAYVTGNVASNLFGRLLSATTAEHFGIAANFYLFACLNVAGAVLAWCWLGRTPIMLAPGRSAPLAAWAMHLRNGHLRRGFAIGFLILFAFIGTFTYVNFVLVRPPLSVSMMSLGLVYLVFLPAILTTPLAGHVARRFGARPAFWLSLGAAVLGLPMLLTPSLPTVLFGLALVGAGTFFAQATATGFVSRTAMAERGAASGLYLASYYAGGLVGTAVLGQLFDRLGWTACVVGIGFALAAAAWCAHGLSPATAVERTRA